MRKQLSFIGFLFALFAPALALAAQAQVSLGVNSISPSAISINAGDTVVWTNTSGGAQSVTGNDSLFQSGSIAPGGQFAATFNTSGTYNYYDNAGGSALLGQITVTGNSIQTQTTTYANVTNPNVNYYSNLSANNYTNGNTYQYQTTGQTSFYTGQTNPNASTLMAQVQQLIAQINALQGNAGGAQTPIYGPSGYTNCPQIGRVLSVGASGNDVTSLQQFLGISPATGYFGTQTQAAVQQWQSANGIISYGDPGTTGYGVVGPRTAAAIRLACGSGSTGSGSQTSGGTSGVVGGFLKVEPISGPAPLTTTVTATVNTAASCSGATYTLSYGDSSQNQTISIPPKNCSQQNQSFQHTYQYGGTYTVTLSAGTHSTTATVTVSGTQANSNGQQTGQPAGSMSAFITSGPAPLATTFYVSCASGLAYDVIFGDGSDLGSTGVSQSSCNGGLQAVAHTYAKPGSFNAQLVVFIRNSQGTVSSQAVAAQGITATGPSTANASSSYPPPTLTPNIGANPLAVSLQFTAVSCANSYTIDWGDGVGGNSSPPVDCSTSANPTTATQSYTANHSYTQDGTYTVSLTRSIYGGGQQNDTVGVSISQ
ncbi:MAG TPA: peptidoglycan-binding protein [Candidatus Paceibacterota bacterium]|jgi:plastocyanin|nr:peptidoglycan-binding protein [Candidatus Paceibacterota bacterium]